MGPSEPGDENSFFRAAAALFATVVVVAVFAYLRSPFFVPAIYFLAIYSFEPPKALVRRLWLLFGFGALSIAIGLLFVLPPNGTLIGGMLVAGGLGFTTIGRFFSPPSRNRHDPQK